MVRCGCVNRRRASSSGRAVRWTWPVRCSVAMADTDNLSALDGIRKSVDMPVTAKLGGERRYRDASLLVQDAQNLRMTFRTHAFRSR